MQDKKIKRFFSFLLISTMLIATIFDPRITVPASCPLVKKSCPVLSSSVPLIKNEQNDSGTTINLIDENLVRQFVSIINKNKDLMRKKYLQKNADIRLYEIFQTFVRNYLAWHWTDQLTWETPIDLSLYCHRLPVYSSDTMRANFSDFVTVTQHGNYENHRYLYGNFGNDNFGNSRSWRCNRVFDVSDFLKENLVYTKPELENNLIGFGQVKLNTQNWGDAFFSHPRNLIDLVRLNGHEVGDSILHDYNFPNSGKIRAWNSYDARCPYFTFSDLLNNYLPMNKFSAFNCTLNRVWDQAIKNYVSRKTLFVTTIQQAQEALFDQVPFFDISKLFQLGKVGYDRSVNKYWYTVGFNQSLLKGAIGKYYNQDVQALFALDTSANKVMIDLSKFKYWNDLNQGRAIFVNGGISTWINKNKLNFLDQKHYDDFMIDLKSFFTECLEKEVLTYDNYFVVKQKINQFVNATKSLPSLSWIENNFASNREWQDNGWVSDAQRYNLSSETINCLSLILPSIRYSQFSMFDTTGLGGTTWTNSNQNWNVGVSRINNHKLSTFSNMVNEENKVFLDPIDLKDGAPINIMFNVGLESDLQNDPDFAFQDNYALSENMVSEVTYHACNEENAEAINKLSNGAIQIKKDSTFIDKDKKVVNDFPYYQIKRDGEKIVPTNSLFSQHVSISNALKSYRASDVWNNAKQQFPNDTARALEILFRDQNGSPALPFARADLWTNHFLDYDIPSDKLHVQPDDVTGAININLRGTSQAVQVSGFLRNSSSQNNVAAKSTSHSSSRFFIFVASASVICGVIATVGFFRVTDFFKSRKRSNNKAK